MLTEQVIIINASTYKARTSMSTNNKDDYAAICMASSHYFVGGKYTFRRQKNYIVLHFSPFIEGLLQCVTYTCNNLSQLMENN